MYKIIGSDGRQYGPVTADQVRDWIAAGRANAQTLAQIEGTTEWKPLSLFPEFSSLLSSAAAPPLIPPVHTRKSKVAAGVLGVVLGGIGLHRFYLGYTGIGIAQIVVTIVTCGIGAVWGFVEGILILVGSTITTDADGQPLQE